MKSFAYRIKSQRKELTSMSYDYSENVLVQESAGHLLADELGWQVELALIRKSLERKEHLEEVPTRTFF